MKKLLLFLLLCPFMAMAAKYYEGTITFKDGSTKTGLIDLPGRTDQEVKFKTGKEAKPSEFSITSVEKFVVKVENETWTYVTTVVADKSIFKKGLTLEKERSWARLIREGEITVLALYYINYPSRGWSYALKRENEDFCRNIGNMTDGFSLTAGEFNVMKTFAADILDDCPDYKKSLDRKEFKERGGVIFAEKYEELCGKNKK